jgi:hypothetical protein
VHAICAAADCQPPPISTVMARSFVLDRTLGIGQPFGSHVPDICASTVAAWVPGPYEVDGMLAPYSGRRVRYV